MDVCSYLCEQMVGMATDAFAPLPTGPIMCLSSFYFDITKQSRLSEKRTNSLNSCSDNLYKNGCPPIYNVNVSDH